MIILTLIQLDHMLIQAKDLLKLLEQRKEKGEKLFEETGECLFDVINLCQRDIKHLKEQINAKLH